MPRIRQMRGGGDVFISERRELIARGVKGAKKNPNSFNVAIIPPT